MHYPISQCSKLDMAKQINYTYFYVLMFKKRRIWTLKYYLLT